MSFDEEGDHYMSKADFALICDELKKAVSQRDELMAALKEISEMDYSRSAMNGMGFRAHNLALAAIAKADLTQ